MARSPPGSGGESEPKPGPSHTSVSSPVYRLWDDAVLRIAFLAASLLLAYQLAVTLLQPAWIGAVTDWLHVLVAWSGLLLVGLVSRWLTRAGLPAARSWWWVSAGLLFYGWQALCGWWRTSSSSQTMSPSRPGTISSLSSNIRASSWRCSWCHRLALAFIRRS